MRPNPFMKQISDGDLVSQARLGSEQALTELWSRHDKRTSNVVRRIVRNREDAEDVLQEAYLQSYIHLNSFNGNAQFATWLTSIAVNAAFMLLRKRLRRPEAFVESSESDQSNTLTNLPDCVESVETRYARLERIEQLRACIQQLPFPLRCVLELQSRDGLPLRDIVDKTGLSLPAVKTRLNRARIALRDMTSEDGARKGSPRPNHRCAGNKVSGRIA